MTVEDCITNNIPIWRLKFEGWIIQWTIDNKSDKIKDEVWYIVSNEIRKSSVKDFKVNKGCFVWYKNVIDKPMYREYVEEEIDEKETITCLFKFYHLIK